MLKIARRTISSIAAQVDDDGKDSFRDQPSDSEPSPEAIEDRERKDLEDQIVDKWATVWFGIYQIRERDGPYHFDLLEKLYLGAGAAGHLIKQALENPKGKDGDDPAKLLGLLGVALSTHSRKYYGSFGYSIGIQDLRLFENLSIPTLRSTLELLAAYEKEIEQLQEVYELLRSLQVDLSRTPGPEDEQQVRDRYRALADPIAERILHYNSRLAVLVEDVETEAMETYRKADISVDEMGAPLRNNWPIGWYVRERVFPRRRGKGTGIFSGSSIS